MSRPTLEERMAALEQQVAEMRAELATLAQPQDWRSTIGMFAGDEMMKQIFEEGRKIRAADRQRERRRILQKRRTKRCVS
jgi:hypothetical protein